REGVPVARRVVAAPLRAGAAWRRSASPAALFTRLTARRGAAWSRTSKAQVRGAGREGVLVARRVVAAPPRAVPAGRLVRGARRARRRAPARLPRRPPRDRRAPPAPLPRRPPRERRPARPIAAPPPARSPPGRPARAPRANRRTRPARGCVEFVRV